MWSLARGLWGWRWRSSARRTSRRSVASHAAAARAEAGEDGTGFPKKSRSLLREGQRSVFELIERHARQPLDFEPGAQWQYSNTGFVIAGEVELTIAGEPPASVFYTVQSGDSLSKIAKVHYGDAMKYPEIFEANKPMLKHPDKIYPGQESVIPDLEE